jgi:hypothetical protein
MTTPRLGVPELTSGQTVPETTVNEQIRYVEQGANHFVFIDRDLATPPGSPSDGDCYLVATSGTGAWSGQDGKIAIRVSTSWVFITVKEGMTAYVADEDVTIVRSASAWNSPVATAAEVRAGTSNVVYVTPANIISASAPVALTSSASITPDGDNGINFTLTLAHSGQLENPANFDTGRSGVIVITQDGTGSRTLTYGTNWKFPGGAPVLSTAAAAVDVLAYFVVSGSQIIATLTKAYSS